MSVLIIWLIAAAAFFVALWVYHFVKKPYPFLIVSGAGTIIMSVLTMIYAYDVYLSPQRFDDGRSITAIMRILAGNDHFSSPQDLFSGIINGGILIIVMLAIFIFCIVKMRRQKKSDVAEN